MTQLVPIKEVDLKVFGNSSVMSEEDKAKVREYAKLEKMRVEILAQLKKIDSLMEFIDSKWCGKYLWKNQANEVIPIFDIEDDYLKNIYNWQIRNGLMVSKEIKKEYISRFGIPDSLPVDDAKYMPSKKKKSGYGRYDLEEDNDFMF